MKNTPSIMFLFAALSSFAAFGQQGAPPFEFSGFRLGMAKKDLGAMSPAMRPWKPVGMMEARKDEWALLPKGAPAKTLPTFQQAESHGRPPEISSIKLAFTNGVLCRIEAEGPATINVAKAREWACAAVAALTAKIGKPGSDCPELDDLSGEAMLEALRKSGMVGALWPNASVSVFRSPDSGTAAAFAGRMVPSFEVSAQKLRDVPVQ